MSEVTTYYECFNNKLEEFLQDLSSSFPDVKDFKLVKNGLQLAKTIDVKMPQRVFDENVANRFEERIIKKDEQFFLTENYADILEDNNVDLDVVSKIKDIWSSLDDCDKDTIWKYLHVLVILNRKCR
jgi:hypothetical protein